MKKVSIQNVAKKIGVSDTTLRKWILTNEDDLTKNKIVGIVKHPKRKTIVIFDEEKLIGKFFGWE